MQNLLIILMLLLSSSLSAQKNLIDKKLPIINSGSRVFYKDGIQIIQYYNGGLFVAAAFEEIDVYGKYFQVNIEIINKTGQDFTFFPSKIIAYLNEYKLVKKTDELVLKDQTLGELLASEDYLKKVKNRQSWTKFFSNMNLSQKASMAGYTSSNTQISSSSNSTSAASNYKSSYIGTTSSNVSGSMRTQSFDGQAAYQAQKEVEQEARERDLQLDQFKNEIKQGYLKTNTIENNQKLSGFINITRDDAEKVEIYIPISGRYFYFLFDVQKK